MGSPPSRIVRNGRSKRQERGCKFLSGTCVFARVQTIISCDQFSRYILMVLGFSKQELVIQYAPVLWEMHVLHPRFSVLWNECCPNLSEIVVSHTTRRLLKNVARLAQIRKWISDKFMQIFSNVFFLKIVTPAIPSNINLDHALHVLGGSRHGTKLSTTRNQNYVLHGVHLLRLCLVSPPFCPHSCYLTLFDVISLSNWKE